MENRNRRKTRPRQGRLTREEEIRRENARQKAVLQRHQEEEPDWDDDDEDEGFELDQQTLLIIGGVAIILLIGVYFMFFRGDKEPGNQILVDQTAERDRNTGVTTSLGDVSDGSADSIEKRFNLTGSRLTKEERDHVSLEGSRSIRQTLEGIVRMLSSPKDNPVVNEERLVPESYNINDFFLDEERPFQLALLLNRSTREGYLDDRNRYGDPIKIPTPKVGDPYQFTAEIKVYDPMKEALNPEDLFDYEMRRYVTLRADFTLRDSIGEMPHAIIFYLNRDGKIFDFTYDVATQKERIEEEERLKQEAEEEQRQQQQQQQGGEATSEGNPR